MLPYGRNPKRRSPPFYFSKPTEWPRLAPLAPFGPVWPRWPHLAPFGLVGPVWPCLAPLAPFCPVGPICHDKSKTIDHGRRRRKWAIEPPKMLCRHIHHIIESSSMNQRSCRCMICRVSGVWQVVEAMLWHVGRWFIDD